MKTDLKAKLLQHYIKKNGNKGFTLIELLVVVIIIGILAAVALPSMLNQANRARQAGAQSSVGAVNRAQQAYRLENTTFATGHADLKINDPSTDDYTITVLAANTAASGDVTAVPLDTGSGLLGYRGCVSVLTGTNAGVTEAKVTEATNAAAPATCP